jgi:class 3 adenylate cyclase
MKPEQLDASATADGERKTITALFADIKGSTELMRDLDPEEARAIVDPVLQLMMEAVHRYGGYVAQSTGDGIFALFGAPVAHEDHPQRALHAALAMQEELRRLRRSSARGGQDSRRGANRGEHRRSSGAVDTSWRTYRVHAGRACDKSRGADANRGASGIDSGQ